MPDDDKRFFIKEDTDIEELIRYWVEALGIPEEVAREGVLEWERRGGVTLEEQANIFHTAQTNYSLNKLVNEGLMDMTVDENGEFLFSITDLGRTMVEQIQKGESP